ncbi:MAG TPA: NAD(P)/FAD-dependent oxidoreductase [Solirubrobacteraceae bacterium]|nr:NAD(P)/FAD-dependent oxidoreductase [Solirubrobacteraceae bacterium]
MSSEFDVIVVGARCAGSPLATLLARQGLRVAVAERAEFPRDTLSTHIFEVGALNFLRRLGVLDEVIATGAPIVWRVDGRQDDFRYEHRPQPRPGDVGLTMSVRRFLLDPILAGAATRDGAEVMSKCNVVGLSYTGSRVSGVRIIQHGDERELTARLVVGADGRTSTIAGLVGSRKYNVVESERFGYWGFFEGAAVSDDPAIVFHRWDGRFVIATAADSGLYQALAIPDQRFRAAFKADRDAAYMEHVMACEPVAEILRGARRVGKLFGMKRWQGFFRESAGPGWALVGDAGHFKDVAPGQGIMDAFRQAEALAPVIAGALGGSDAELDAAVAEWARWRDRDAAEHYWLAVDFGSAGRMPAVVPEMMRRLDRRGELDQVTDLVQHRIKPSRVFSPGRLLGATAALMVRPGGAGRRTVLREVGDLMREDLRRRRLTLRPDFVTPDAHHDAGETEVTEAPVSA